MHLPCRCHNSSARRLRKMRGCRGTWWEWRRARSKSRFAGAGGKERIRTDKDRVGATLTHGGESGIDLARRAGIESEQLETEGARSLLRVVSRALGFRKF